MAHRDDTDRVLASCRSCEAVYAARQWPDGDVRLIGQEGCECGATEFDVLSKADVTSDRDEPGPSSGVGDE